jgi:bacteriorhodopsin
MGAGFWIGAAIGGVVGIVVAVTLTLLIGLVSPPAALVLAAPISLVSGFGFTTLGIGIGEQF